MEQKTQPDDSLSAFLHHTPADAIGSAGDAALEQKEAHWGDIQFERPANQEPVFELKHEDVDFTLYNGIAVLCAITGITGIFIHWVIVIGGFVFLGICIAIIAMLRRQVNEPVILEAFKDGIWCAWDKLFIPYGRIYMVDGMVDLYGKIDNSTFTIFFTDRTDKFEELKEKSNFQIQKENVPALEKFTLYKYSLGGASGLHSLNMSYKECGESIALLKSEKVTIRLGTSKKT